MAFSQQNIKASIFPSKTYLIRSNLKCWTFILEQPGGHAKKAASETVGLWMCVFSVRELWRWDESA
jgi:hypothetical protein